MPVVGGVSLVRELRARRPNLPVLFLSGARDSGAETEQFGGRTSFLEKPFLAEELLDAVCQLVEEADGSRHAPRHSP